MKVKSLGSRNRTAGHNYERQIAKELREMGFTHAKTSRQASRLYDDCKIDIWGVPLNIQCKNSKQKLDANEIFKTMINAVKKELPGRLNMPFLLFHKKDRKETVTMSKMDFYRIINQLEELKSKNIE